MVGVVGGAQAADKGLVQVPERATAVGKGDALGPMLLHDGFQPPGHLVQGFVPADTAPLAFAAPALADHGRLNALVVPDQGPAGGPPRADRPLHGGDVGVALQELDLAVFHFGHDGAAHRAHAADAVHLLSGHLIFSCKR